MLHTWSLAVEEQFYLTFPIILFLIHRYWRTGLAAMLWIGAIISLLLCIWVMEHSTTAAFYLPFTRSYELLIGSILAAGAVPKVTNRRLLDGLSVIGLIMIVMAIACYSEETSFPGVAALLPCLGAALILLAGEDSASLAGRWLSQPLLTFFGAISYSLYLWHWPFIVFVKYFTLGKPDIAWISGAVIGATAAAWLSFRFVEQPFLKRAKSKKTVFMAGGAMAAIVGSVAIVVVVLDGVPERFSPAARSYLAAAQDFNPRRSQCHNDFARAFSYSDSCSFGSAGVRPSIAVWSDSFGAELSVALGDQAEKRGMAVRQLSSSSCPPSLNYRPPEREGCAQHNQVMLEELIRDPDIKTVVIAANYTLYPPDRHFFDGLHKAMSTLAAAGKHIVIVYPVPKFPFPVPQALAIENALGEPAPSFAVPAASFRKETALYRHFLDKVATEVKASSIKPDLRLCDRDRCEAYAPHWGALYFDDRHLSVTGSRFALVGADKALLPLN